MQDVKLLTYWKTPGGGGGFPKKRVGGAPAKKIKKTLKGAKWGIN